MAQGRELLRAAKASASSPHPALCLPIDSPVGGLLRPVVTRQGAIPAADIAALTKWRNRFVHAFLSEFVASEQRTERWLVESVGPDDSRILFMVEDVNRRTTGYMGLAFIDWGERSAEVDAVVRGVEGSPGLQTRALHTMCRWARNTLALSTIGARVRSDNSATAFYEKAGFREIGRVPMRRQQRSDGWQWVEDPTAAGAALSLVYLELDEDRG